MIRAAAALFPGDDALLNIPMYRRHNRSRKGTLAVGDAAPAVELVRLRRDRPYDPQTAMWSDLSALCHAAPAQRLVVLASSGSLR